MNICRQLRLIPSGRLLFFALFLIVFYVFSIFTFASNPIEIFMDFGEAGAERRISRAERMQRRGIKEESDSHPTTHPLKNHKKEISVEKLLTNYNISLEEKLNCKAKKDGKPKLLVSINAGHDNSNLGGCPDWNCEISYDRSRIPEADAVLLSYDENWFEPRPDQYVIFYSQESPRNWYAPRTPVNMTLGFRHDSPVASPYGYTVKLKEKKTGELVNKERIKGKAKGAAWFVSNCHTSSNREKLVEKLKKKFPIDIYGECGEYRCPRGAACTEMLNTDYFFYLAFENSLCKDYITEKVWYNGYQHDIVPVVLKRSIVEPFVPPNSFIAVDDFKNIQELAKHFHHLMNNHTAYEEYFAWRSEYKVIFLDGKQHDKRERPWGFCQVCRLMWEKPKKEYMIKNFDEYWTKSCEKDGELVARFL